MTEQSGPVRHAFAPVDGLRLHRLELDGDESEVPLVCLHGVTGHAWLWHDVAMRLAGSRRVLSLDMRGHGDSQWSPQQAYRTADHIADLAATLNLLGLERVDIAGLSWGGLVGLGLAVRRPGLVRSLTLVDVPPSFEQDEREVPDRPDSFAGHEQAVAWERAANPNAPASMVQMAAAHGTRPAADGRLVRKHDDYFASRWPFRSDDAWAELECATLPTLIVHGVDSYVLSAPVAERMAATAPDARLVQIAGCGHLVPVERPVELADALTDFIERQD